MKRTQMDDAEYGRFIRLQNRIRSERQRRQMQEAGLGAVTLWIPVALRAALVEVARERGATINEVATAILQAGMPAVDVPAMQQVAQVPPPAKARPVAANLEQDEVMEELDRLVQAGESYGAVARRWNAAGRQTTKGAEFRSNSLARAHQRWANRNTGKGE